MTCVDGERYVTNIKDGTLIGYKYIDLAQTRCIEVVYQTDAAGCFEIYSDLGQEKRAVIGLEPGGYWIPDETDVTFGETENELYLIYRGKGSASLLTVNLKDKV